MKKNTMESENGYKKGFWTEEEDKILVDYIKVNGKGRWNHISKKTGLKRCGKSCRLRWMNYLSPNVKRGNFTEQEEDLIIRLHNLLGNRWSLIAKRVPGRTDNQVKNYWNTHLIKKLAVNNNEKTGRLKINDRSSRIGVSSSKFSKPDTNPGRNECVSPIETSAITVDEGFQKSTQELTLKESYDQNSFWFYDDHSLEFSTIFGTESFDGYFL